MIAALMSMGRLEKVDSALVAAVRSLADAVDVDPANASLWREYRAAENDLRGIGAEVDDELTKALADLRTTVGDEEKPKAKDTRTKRGGGSQRSRTATDAVAKNGR
jgi:hypothetical protein